MSHRYFGSANRVRQMGNVNFQCPTCGSWDVNKQWNFTRAYFECANCGFIWR